MKEVYSGNSSDLVSATQGTHLTSVKSRRGRRRGKGKRSAIILNVYKLNFNNVTSFILADIMKFSGISAILLFFFLCINFCQCNQNNTSLTLVKQKEDKDAKAVQQIVRGLKSLWTWIKVQAGHEDTFVGRCAGAFKKMRMAFTFIIFKLGVIGTTLAFLSIFALKSLGIGVLLLILNSIGLFAKVIQLKKDGGHHDTGQGSGQVHLHLHNKPAYSYSPPSHHHHHGDDSVGWYDRSGHVVTRSPLERLAILDLYKRLGIRNEAYGLPNDGIDAYS